VNATARILSTGQVAERLRLHIRKIQRMAESGDLPYIEKLPGLNGRYLFDAAVVEMKRRQLDAEREAS
jgi:excisionase family DNA binding protein